MSGASAGAPTGPGAPATPAEAGTAAGAPSAAALLERLVAEAFGRGEAGVAALHRYASDRMRGKLGGPEVFRRAFGNALYAPLLHHDGLRAAEPVVIDDSARAEVVVSYAGEEVRYLVALARSRYGERAGLWTLSGVARDGVDL
ncbi:MAG: hypothetical protein GX560_10395 [Deinococcales bacterium]|nr:hypothetical protein [Deinococcales bacterium]